MNLKKFLSLIVVLSLGSALSARADDYVDESKPEAQKYHKDKIDPKKFDQISEEVMEKVREEFEREHPKGASFDRVIVKEKPEASGLEFLVAMATISKNSALLEKSDLLQMDKEHFTAVLTNYIKAKFMFEAESVKSLKNLSKIMLESPENFPNKDEQQKLITQRKAELLSKRPFLDSLIAEGARLAKLSAEGKLSAQEQINLKALNELSFAVKQDITERMVQNFDRIPADSRKQLNNNDRMAPKAKQGQDIADLAQTLEHLAEENAIPKDQ